jgi:hypothetical protein
MRNLSLVALALALLLTPNAAHADDYLESVATSTTSAVSATAREGSAWYAVECTAETRYRTCTSSTCTATSNDEKIPITTLFDVYLPAGRSHFAFILAASTGTCRIYRALWQQRF